MVNDMTLQKKWNVKIIFIPLLILFLISCDSGNDRTSYSSSPSKPIYEAVVDILALFSNHPIIKGLRFLKIITNANNAINKNASSANNVSFYTTNPNVTGQVNLSSNYNGYATFQNPRGDVINFSPSEFMRVNNLQEGDEIALQRLDSKMQADYTECTDEALNSGASNHIQLLELRLSCFERKGYNSTDNDYMRIKHEQYI
jgi:hypothetical protein